MKRIDHKGFTLVELMVVIIISGILVTVALRGGRSVQETAKVSQAKEELEALAFGIAGNPSLSNNGHRSDFGYIGDIGAMPPNLDALRTNTAGLATWRGPYVVNKRVGNPADYRTDPWQTAYAYSGGTSIICNGSGSAINKSIAASTADLLYNGVSGNVLDVDGTPPGAVYRDSVTVRMLVPNGAGGMASRMSSLDEGGYFAFDSLPIGNHELQIVYQPGSDTLRRYLSVEPGSDLYGQYRFLTNRFSTDSSTTTTTYVSGSDTVYSSTPHCENLSFWLTNTTGASLSITTIRFTWSSPSAYYGRIYWNNDVVFDNDGSPRGESSIMYPLNASQTLLAGESVKIRVTDFRSNNTSGGGPKVDMSNVHLSYELSDGSSTVIIFGACI